MLFHPFKHIMKTFVLTVLTTFDMYTEMYDFSMTHTDGSSLITPSHDSDDCKTTTYTFQLRLSYKGQDQSVKDEVRSELSDSDEQMSLNLSCVRI